MPNQHDLPVVIPAIGGLDESLELNEVLVEFVCNNLGNCVIKYNYIKNHWFLAEKLKKFC